MKVFAVRRKEKSSHQTKGQDERDGLELTCLTEQIYQLVSSYKLRLVYQDTGITTFCEMSTMSSTANNRKREKICFHINPYPAFSVITAHL